MSGVWAEKSISLVNSGVGRASVADGRERVTDRSLILRQVAVGVTADRDSAPVKVGEQYSVEIEDLGSEGDGIARIGSFVVFVPGADLGERVDIRIEGVGGSHAVASVVDGEGPASAP